jgi:hypothetical protein
LINLNDVEDELKNMDAVGHVVCAPHSDATFLRLVGQILIVDRENRIASMCKQTTWILDFVSDE